MTPTYDRHRDVTSDAAADGDVHKHLDDVEAAAYVAGAAVPPRVHAHLKGYASDFACPCHHEVYRALDQFLARQERLGAAWSPASHRRVLGLRLLRRHVCPENAAEAYLQPDGSDERDSLLRHLRFCPHCFDEVADILEMMTPGSYEPLPPAPDGARCRRPRANGTPR